MPGARSENSSGPYRLILMLLLAEYLYMIFSGATPTGLQGDPFFSLSVDPAAWAFRLSGIPHIILNGPALAVTMDLLIGVLIVMLILKPGRSGTAILLFFLLFGSYLILVSCLTHRNFQAGFFWVLFPFIFADRGRSLAFEFIRYFLLFFYFSAGMFKLVNGAYWDAGLFSGHLSGQFAPYFLEGNTGWRTQWNSYLVGHLGTAHILYGLGILAELMMCIGFFTRRYDRVLGILLLFFHIFNWIIMDIGVVGQVTFISILFLSRRIISVQDTLHIDELKPETKSA